MSTQPFAIMHFMKNIREMTSILGFYNPDLDIFTLKNADNNTKNLDGIMYEWVLIKIDNGESLVIGSSRDAFPELNMPDLNKVMTGNALNVFVRAIKTMEKCYNGCVLVTQSRQCKIFRYISECLAIVPREISTKPKNKYDMYEISPRCMEKVVINA